MQGVLVELISDPRSEVTVYHMRKQICLLSYTKKCTRKLKQICHCKYVCLSAHLCVLPLFNKGQGTACLVCTKGIVCHTLTWRLGHRLLLK